MPQAAKPELEAPPMGRPEAFDAVMLGAYLMEVHDLCDALLYRLKRLEDLSVRWCDERRARDAASIVPDSGFGTDDTESLRRQGALQSHIFDEVEVFLAAWARLSLLYFPDGKSSPFAKQRGLVLTTVFNVDATTCELADRELRNSWMHFDERLDRAVQDRTCGNRHRFVHSPDGEASAPLSLRVVEVDTLRVYYRARSGTVFSTDLRGLEPMIRKIDAERARALERFRLNFTGAEVDQPAASA